MIVAVGSDAQWLGCVRALEMPELESAPHLTTNAGRVAHRSEVVAAIAARLATRSAAAWRARFELLGVPTGLVCSVPEALRALGGATARTGVPPAVPGSIRLPPPALDEHGDAIRRHGWAVFA